MMKITLADWRLWIEWQSRDGRAWYVRPSGHWVLQSHARVRRSRCRLAKRVPPVSREEETTLSILLRRWPFFFFFLLFSFVWMEFVGFKMSNPNKKRWRKKVPWFIDLCSLFTWWVKMGRLQTKQTTCEDMIGRRETAWKAIKHSTAQTQTHTQLCVCVCVDRLATLLFNSQTQFINFQWEMSHTRRHPDETIFFFFTFRWGEKKRNCPQYLNYRLKNFVMKKKNKTLMMKQLVAHTIRDSGAQQTSRLEF